MRPPQQGQDGRQSGGPGASTVSGGGTTASSSRARAIDDRATWDRAAWNRYITAATQLEPDFMPEMLGLIREIERLERLVAIPAAPQTSAG
jgi:hypothetical protein